MRVGILETGAPPKRLQPQFGTYVSMFETLIGPGYDYATFDVPAGELPGPEQACDAYVITGSAAGAYDDLPWIAPLSDFLNDVKGRAKLVGVCFGHQMMAQAFGGQVIKSPKGWGVGLHTYRIATEEPWMDSAAPISIAVSHQDQVVALPPGARAVGGSGFTPFGIIAYDDQPAMSLQCHPEYSAGFAEALYETRWDAISPQAETAIASMQAHNDNARVGGWIRRFLDAR